MHAVFMVAIFNCIVHIYISCSGPCGTVFVDW